jgi:hypothetical protein
MTLGGKGGGSQTFDDLKPKTQQQIDLENKFYGISDRVLNGATTGDYGTDQLGRYLTTARDQQNTANDRYNYLGGQIGAYDNQRNSALTAAGSAGDWQKQQANNAFSRATTAGDDWYGRSSDAFDRANSMIRQSDENATLSSESNKWYDQYAQGQLTGASNLLESGQIPEELEARMLDTINRGTKTGMGSMLNDLAQRGVINSSVTGQGISRLGQQAANAYNDGYLNTFNSVLQGYQGNAAGAANSAKAFADTYLNINRDLNSGAQTAIDLGNSLAGTGSMRTSDQLNVGNALQNAGSQNISDQLALAGGWQNAAMAGLMEREQIMNQIPQFWDNAMASTNYSRDWLKQVQDDRARDTRTTVVDQGKK